MKKKIFKALILMGAAVLLVVATVFTTIAFLASSTAVSNTFTVGKVGISMYESKVDSDGQDADGASKTSDGNSYELVPGKTYCKDPTIFVDVDSVNSYLFVKVKNGISTIEKQGDANNPTIAEQMTANGWQQVKSNDAGEILYIYVGVGNVTDSVETVAPIAISGLQGEEYDIFDTFTVDESAVVADYAGAKVTLTAFAIQTTGFTDKDGLKAYQHAWNAIVDRFPFESGTHFRAS